MCLGRASLGLAAFPSQLLSCLLVVHPFCIGRHPRIALLDQFFEHMQSFPDVWLAMHLEVAEEWRSMQEAAGLWEAGALPTT